MSAAWPAPLPPPPLLSLLCRPARPGSGAPPPGLALPASLAPAAVPAAARGGAAVDDVGHVIQAVAQRGQRGEAAHVAGRRQQCARAHRPLAHQRLQHVALRGLVVGAKPGSNDRGDKRVHGLCGRWGWGWG